MQRKAPYRTSRKQAGASKSRTAANATIGARGAKPTADTPQAEPSGTAPSAQTAGKRTKTVLTKEVALEILQQSVANAVESGMRFSISNYGPSQVSIMLWGAYYCTICGNFSIGDKCAKEHTAHS
jgi:hypothetical protein